MASTTAFRPAKGIARFSEEPTNITRVNVAPAERWASLLAGGALTAYGLSRRTPGGLALALLGGGLLYRGGTGHSLLYDLLGVRTAAHGPHASIAAGHGVRVEEAVTIHRRADELYRLWRHFQNLPRFMSHLEAVETTGANRYHWVARGPLGLPVAWDAEIVTDRPNELIGWRSLEGSAVDTAGSVHFTPAPEGEGTEVRVTLKYDPPGGQLGAAVARLFASDPGQQLREDLQRFKRVMEAGAALTRTTG